MNEIVNKFLLAGDTFVPEMHLRQSGFTYSACGTSTKKKKKNKERRQKFKETGDSRYIYQNELGKACFQHDMAYGDFEDLNRRTFAHKVLQDKAFNVAKDSKYDGYQYWHVCWHIDIEFFDKKSSGSGINSEIISNKELGEELHKPIIRKWAHKGSEFYNRSMKSWLEKKDIEMYLRRNAQLKWNLIM